MQPLQQTYIAGSSSGLRTDIKPFLQPDNAFVKLENAYVFRERVKKREGLEFVGRLRRVLINQVLGMTDGAGLFTGNIIGILGLETTAQIQAGNVSITVTNGISEHFTEPSPPDGTLTGDLGGSGTINYASGQVVLASTIANGTISINFHYFPGLPVQGIWIRDLPTINVEQTVFFDTKYAYIFSGVNFDELDPTKTWNATDADFFWCENYRGADASTRLFFTTNFICNNANPMRYLTGVASTWTDFAPGIFAALPADPATNFLFSARILISYYGRLVALNTFEGVNRGTASNFYARARYSQIGNPIGTNSWRSDQPGQGGFIDAPTNEAIVSARFFKNTLIVGFERSTWQLLYVGEYGLPFRWERVSSDFGAESTFSTVLFDDGVLQIGNTAITAATAYSVERIDLQIPDQVFDFRNSNNGTERIWGVRDFQRELVFWNYVDVDLEEDLTTFKFPNKTLVYNYRNNTYAKFRDNVTAFGTLQLQNDITWDSTDTFWDDEDVYWNDTDELNAFPRIVCGNQQGYVNYYGYVFPDEVSLAISAVDLTTTPVQITVPNHNLASGEWIGIFNSIWDGVDPNLNNAIYQVSVIDQNTLGLFFWENGSASAVTSTSLATYMGLGEIALYPVVDIETKDFNPYQSQGSQLKLAYVDFLLDAFPPSVMGVQIIVNNSPSAIGNLLVGNKYLESDLQNNGQITAATKSNPCIVTSPNHGLRTNDIIVIEGAYGMPQLNNSTSQPTYTVTYLTANTFSINVDSSAFGTYIGGATWENQAGNLYVLGSNYAWHRFFATSTGQFLRLRMYYDENLMSLTSTHSSNWILNAISLWTRPGSRNIL